MRVRWREFEPLANVMNFYQNTTGSVLASYPTPDIVSYLISNKRRLRCFFKLN
jgi:hypothetical protein